MAVVQSQPTLSPLSVHSQPTLSPASAHSQPTQQPTLSLASAHSQPTQQPTLSPPSSPLSAHSQPSLSPLSAHPAAYPQPTLSPPSSGNRVTYQSGVRVLDLAEYPTRAVCGYLTSRSDLPERCADFEEFDVSEEFEEIQTLQAQKRFNESVQRKELELQ
ncbi:uncharacterized protein [Procambarus clarkii]|uniref:uncharacterized protein n=1 Tax=Procambarus clarkii TaxID=6728 RepID=UPI0037427A9B